MVNFPNLQIVAALRAISETLSLKTLYSSLQHHGQLMAHLVPTPTTTAFASDLHSVAALREMETAHYR